MQDHSLIAKQARRIANWFRDDIFHRLFVNASWLLSAGGIVAVLGFVTAFLTARVLQPAGYGMLALVLAYVHVVGKLVSFQAWQAIIKFGSEALANKDNARFQKLVKFGFVLDAGSAIIGTVVAIGASSYLIGLLEWDQSLRPAVLIYSWLILFSLGGTPVGLLRLFNRFDLLSYSNVATAVMRLAGVFWCWWTGQGLIGFVWVYLISGSVGHIYLLAMVFYQLQQRRLTKFIWVSLRGVASDFPGVLNYVWTTNLHATVKLLSREVDLIIVAAFTSPAGVGVYKLAKQFAKILSTFSDPLYQSIFPELAHLWSKQQTSQFVSLMKRATLFIGVGALLCWAGFLLLGHWLITFVVGPDYSGAYPVAAIYMLGTVIALLTFSFTPALLAMGLPVKSFFANLIATIFYFMALIPFMLLLDITGAALAYVVYYLVWSTVMLYILLPRLRQPQLAGVNVKEI